MPAATAATLGLGLLTAATAAGALTLAFGRVAVQNPASLAGACVRGAACVAATAVMLWGLRAASVRGPAAAGLRPLRFADARAVAAGIAAVVALRALAYAYLAVIGEPAHVEAGLEHFAYAGPAGAAAALFVAAVLAPFAEELFFRGILFGALAERLGVPRAALLSGLGFAASRLDVALFPFFFCYGIVLAALYRRTGTLWVPVLVRSVFDGATVAALLWLDLAVPR